MRLAYAIAAASYLPSVALSFFLPGALVSRASSAARYDSDAWRMDILDSVQNAAAGAKATVDGIKATYEDETFVPDGFVKARHILFLKDDDADRKASALAKRIAAGEIGFAEAALRFSCCPTRDLNGSLGIFSSLSRLAEGTLRGDSTPYDGQDTKDFDDLVLSPTTMLNVVHTVRSQWGTHLVLVEERGGSPAAADPVGQAAELVGRAMGGGDGGGGGGSRKKNSKRKRRKGKK